MAYAAALDALTTRAARRRADRSTSRSPRARRAASSRRACADGRASRATTSRPSGARPARPARLRRAAQHAHRSRASCSRRPTSCADRTRRARRLVARQLEAFKDNFARVDLTRAKRSEPDALRRADHRLDDRARGRRRRASAGSSPRVIYNRLQAGHPARHRRDDRATRANNWTRPLHAVRAAAATRPTTRGSATRPAADADRQPRARRRSAPPPTRRTSATSTTSSSRAATARTASRATDAEFQRDVAAYNRKREELGGKDPSQC